MNKHKGRVVIYLVDNSFFCVRAYNHIDQENEPCLRCLFSPDYAIDQGCKPMTAMDLSPKSIKDFREWVHAGKLTLLTQNETQSKLARKCFGEAAKIMRVGLWTVDWPKTFGLNVCEDDRNEFDVVFHAAEHPAKGFLWTLEVAKLCPELTFLFPSQKPSFVNDDSIPINATFKPMSWESGLESEVAKAKLVLVPSLWSAPIEGALIKSIMQARATAVIDLETNFGSELEGIVLRLSTKPEEAAVSLCDAVRNKWRPNQERLIAWEKEFRKTNEKLLSNIYRALDD